MQTGRLGQRGVTMLEILIMLAILAIIAAVALPEMVGAIQRARSRGVADDLRVAIRDARARAMGTGWQFRVMGYNASSAVRPNEFRIEGRSDTAVPWPLQGTPGPFQTSTQTADRWVRMATEYPGVILNPGDGGGNAECGAASTFCFTFNFAGILVPANSYPGPGGGLQVAGAVSRRISSSLAGAVRIQ